MGWENRGDLAHALGGKAGHGSPTEVLGLPYQADDRSTGRSRQESGAVAGSPGPEAPGRKLRGRRQKQWKEGRELSERPAASVEPL